MKWMKLLSLIGLAIFAFIVYSIGLQQISESISRLNLPVFLLALSIFIPVILLKALKQQLILKGLGAKISISDSAKIWLIGYFFSIISPGKAGDAVKSVYFAEKTKLSPAKGLAAVAIERLFDIAILLIFALIGFVAISSRYILQADFVTPMAAVLLVFIIAVLLFSRKHAAAFLLRPFFRFLVPKRYGEKLKTGFNDFFEAVQELGKKKFLLLEICLLTLLAWAIIIFQYNVSAAALQIPVSYEFLFAVMPIVNLVGILPISFNGIGTRDATLIFFFGLIGITAGTAVSFSLIILLTNLLLGFIGWVFSQKEKVKL